MRDGSGHSPLPPAATLLVTYSYTIKIISIMKYLFYFFYELCSRLYLCPSDTILLSFIPSIVTVHPQGANCLLVSCVIIGKWIEEGKKEEGWNIDEEETKKDGVTQDPADWRKWE